MREAAVLLELWQGSHRYGAWRAIVPEAPNPMYKIVGHDRL